MPVGGVIPVRDHAIPRADIATPAYRVDFMTRAARGLR